MTVRRFRRAAVAVLAFAVPVHATCNDGVLDGRESDVDCGGECPACERGDRCFLPTDCYSGRCATWVCEERVYLKGDRVPLGYRVESSDADGAAITRSIGWVSLGIGYGTAYVAALSLPGELSWLYAPVIGPWIKVADPDQNLKGIIAIDGFLQTVGAALVIGGIAAGGQQLVRDEVTLARVRVTPVVSERGGGLWMFGAF